MAATRRAELRLASHGDVNGCAGPARGQSHRVKFPGDVAAGIPSPIPNTSYKHKGIDKTITPPGGENPDHKMTELELTPEALAYYDDLEEKRRGLADSVRVETGETEFELGTSIRATWIPLQRADKSMMPMFKKNAVLEDGHRIAPDGLAERLVHLPAPEGPKWVPIVPEGFATSILSWKRWLWTMCHVGIIGAHCP